ncbi:SPOR domain-containing protein [Kaarinaea lacus]
MLKQRLIGAVVLIALGVIFIPMLLTGDGKFLSDDMESNVPPKPMYELEAPKVIPLDKRAVQSGGPVVEPAPQADKMDSASEENDDSTTLAKTEPVKPEPSTKESAAPGESKTTDTPATVAEAQKAPEKIPDAPAADKVTKPESKPVEKPVTAPVTTTASKKPVVSGWAVQLGSFSVQKNALKLRDSLRKKGYASFVEEYTSNGKTSYRVRVGPELTRDLANELKKKLKAETKLDGFVVEFPGK